MDSILPCPHGCSWTNMNRTWTNHTKAIKATSNPRLASYSSDFCSPSLLPSWTSLELLVWWSRSFDIRQSSHLNFRHSWLTTAKSAAFSAVKWPWCRFKSFQLDPIGCDRLGLQPLLRRCLPSRERHLPLAPLAGQWPGPAPSWWWTEPQGWWPNA